MELIAKKNGEIKKLMDTNEDLDRTIEELQEDVKAKDLRITVQTGYRERAEAETKEAYEMNEFTQDEVIALRDHNAQLEKIVYDLKAVYCIGPASTC